MMVYQTLKFYFVRTGLSVFLMMTLGFGALYFFHEIALPYAKVDDTVVQSLLGFVCLFMGFFAYGLFGDHLFDKALRALKGISFEQVKEQEIIRQFENLLEFTFSSYFLPRRGRRMRKEVVREYAEFLHSIGKDDPSALRVYLKAFLQNPNDSRFRIPLLSVLKSTESLQPAEIDLLLVMLKTEEEIDKVIISHLAAFFLVQERFNRKTEPVFLAAINYDNKDAEKILDFVLPLLMEKKRTDEVALKFYLRALDFDSSRGGRLREIISENYCHGHWEAIDPELHEKCGKVFNELSEEKRKEIMLEVKESHVSEKLKKLKLFSREDVKVLQGLKLEFGIVKSGWTLIREGAFWLVRSLNLLFKTIILNTLEVLIWFKNSSLVLKLASLSLVVLLVLGGIGAWQVQKEKEAVPPAVIEDPTADMKVSSKDSGVSKVHTIQIAAVTYKKKADKMVKKLRGRGVAGLYIIKTKRRTGGYWYKIRLEKFSEKEDAKRFADHMIDRGIIKNYFIVTYVPQSP